MKVAFAKLNKNQEIRVIRSCMLKHAKSKRIPKGQSYKARLERCILKVKCQNELSGRSKKFNPWAVCKASVKNDRRN
jgi:hypothetical protein